MQKLHIKFACVLLLLLASFSLSAQDLFFAKEQKIDVQNTSFESIGWCGDRLYTYRGNAKDGYFLDAYNDSMRLLATIALDFLPKKIAGSNFYVANNHIIMLYQAVQRDQMIQYAVRLNEKGLIQGKPKVLDSVRTAWLSKDRQYFDNVASFDHTRLMVITQGKKSSNKHSFHTVLLNDELEILSKQSPTLLNRYDAYVAQYVLAKDGTLYVSVSSDDRLKKLGEQNYIFQLTPNAKMFNYIEVPREEDRSVNKWFLKINEENNQLVFATTYAGPTSGKNIEGLITGVFNPDASKFEQFFVRSFSDDLRTSSSERNFKKAFNVFEVRDIIVKNNGGALIILENYFVTTRSYGTGGNFGYYSMYNGPYVSNTVREYVYGDLLIVNQNNEGTITWQNYVRKDQYTQDDGGIFSSYGLINSGTNLLFFFNDFSSSRGFLNIALLDPNGEMQLTKLTNSIGGSADWLIRSGKQTDAQEYLIPILTKNGLSFVRITF
jgi:hypothetical protein